MNYTLGQKVRVKGNVNPWAGLTDGTIATIGLVYPPGKSVNLITKYGMTCFATMDQIEPVEVRNANTCLRCNYTWNGKKDARQCPHCKATRWQTASRRGVSLHP